MDIHKDSIAACCVTGPGKKEIRSFGTMTGELLELCGWLKERAVECVAMESTASYWKPIFNMLESEDIPAILVNARHIKNVPGRKTDIKDSEWIADLLRHGLLKASFVPDRDARELKELVRYREKLIEERAREYNRMDKVLQGANIKLSSVASRMNTVSATDMCWAIARGEMAPEALAHMAKGTMKGKIPELERALKGFIQPHQQMMLRSMLEHISWLGGQIGMLSGEIDSRMEGVSAIVDALDVVPGIGKESAQAIISEMGIDMSVFPSAGHLTSWAGLSPGSNESAGKKKKVKAHKGNTVLKRKAVQCARSAARTKNTYLSSLYNRIAARRGANVACVAVARTILEICYYMIRDGTAFEELGADYLTKQNKEGIIKRSVKKIEALGFKVTVEEVAA
jgi:transposase